MLLKRAMKSRKLADARKQHSFAARRKTESILSNSCLNLPIAAEAEKRAQGGGNVRHDAPGAGKKHDGSCAFFAAAGAESREKRERKKTENTAEFSENARKTRRTQRKIKFILICNIVKLKDIYLKAKKKSKKNRFCPFSTAKAGLFMVRRRERNSPAIMRSALSSCPFSGACRER